MNGKRIVRSGPPIGLVLALLVLAPVAATAELTLTWYTTDGGGWTFSTGGHLSLGGTVGQPDAGIASERTFELFGGFWTGGEGIPSMVEEPPVDPVEAIVFRLLAGVPNPFAEETGILLDLPEARPVAISVFDHGGRLVRDLCDHEVSAGHHRFSWDGRNQAGHRVASGVYLIKVRAGADVARQRVILVR